MSKILIVDDEQSILQTYADAFKEAGFEVITAQDSKSAIITAAKEQPNLILLDLMMPGTNGTIILQHLKKLPETAQIPVAILSVLSEDVPKRLDNPEVFDKTVGYFRKDEYDPQQLLAAIQRFFKEKEFPTTAHI